MVPKPVLLGVELIMCKLISVPAAYPLIVDSLCYCSFSPQHNGALPVALFALRVALMLCVHPSNDPERFESTSVFLFNSTVTLLESPDPNNHCNAFLDIIRTTMTILRSDLGCLSVDTIKSSINF